MIIWVGYEVCGGGVVHKISIVWTGEEGSKGKPPGEVWQASHGALQMNLKSSE